METSRPTTAVRIRTVPNTVNPAPKDKKTVAIEKAKSESNTSPDIQSIIDGIIGEEYLIKLTNESDLTKVQSVQINVDTSFQSLFDIPDLLPNLQSLNLNTSIISSVRDLGVGLRHLLSLSLNECSLNDLDGIGVLVGLETLSINDNYITDLAPLAMHENLQTLHANGNNISDLSFADALSTCFKIREVYLAKNPITKISNFRLIVAYLIPTLELLEGSPVDPNAQTKVSNGMILEAASAMHLVEEEIDDERRLELSLLESNDYFGSTVNGTNSSENTLTEDPLIPDTGSELTHGSSIVLAGNVAAAMRKRRNHAATSSSTSPTSSSSSLTITVRDENTLTIDGGLSTLKVLDSLKNESIAGNGPNSLGHGSDDTDKFFNEGDITQAVASNQNIKLHPYALSACAAAGISDDFLLANMEDDEEMMAMMPNSEGVYPRPSSARKERTSSSYASSPMGNRYTQGPAAANSPLLDKNREGRAGSSRSRSARGNRASSRDGAEGDSDNNRPLVSQSANSRPGTSGGNRPGSSNSRPSTSSGTSSGNYRPRSAAALLSSPSNSRISKDNLLPAHWRASMSFDDDGFKPSMYQEAAGMLGDASGVGKRVSSPRQLNSSRPQSAASVSSGGLSRPGSSYGSYNDVGTGVAGAKFGYGSSVIIQNAPTAPFRVSTSIASCSSAHDTAFSGGGSSSSRSTSTDLSKVQPSMAANFLEDTAICDPIVHSVSEADNERFQREFGRRNVPVPKLRHHNNDKSHENSNDDDDEEESEELYKSSAHEARHRLMSASTRRRQPSMQLSTSDSKTYQENESRASIGLPPTHPKSRGIHTGAIGGKVGMVSRGERSDDDSDDDGGRHTSSLKSHTLLSASSKVGSEDGNLNSISPRQNRGVPKETVSALAGRSLGFDLMGSLAAIDQWVEDMGTSDSDEDTDSESQVVSLDKGANKGAPTSTSVRSGVCGIENLTMVSSPCSTPRRGLSAKHKSGHVGSLTGKGKGGKVVNRDLILDMCCGYERNEESYLLEINVNNVAVTSGYNIDANNEYPNTDSSSATSQASSRLITGESRGTTQKSKPSPLALSNSSNSSNAGYVSSLPSASSMNVGLPMSVQEKTSKRSNSTMRERSNKGSSANKGRQLSPMNPTSPRSSSMIPPQPSLSTTTTIASSSSSPSTADEIIFGDGVFLSDMELIDLLKKPPKSVPTLRTKNSFQDFFKGMRASRMKGLLEAAYADMDHISGEMQQKVHKRMELVREVLTEDE